MPVADIETPDVVRPPTPVKDLIVDAARHAAHFSHEARLARSVARDAVEDSVHAAKRALKQVQRGVERLEDAKDETARYVKRQPFRAVGIAAGVGLLIGACAGWVGARFAGRRRSELKGEAGP
jgi:ElaB/YqjD/DUF883 family membrane-anchored ribosome-binding protein